MNKVVLIGRLTKDPETRQTATINVTRFTVAVDRRNGKEADFINCVAFGMTADFISKYFKKGIKAAIEGHIQTGNYTDKEGKKRYTLDVVVESIEFCESKKSEVGPETDPDEEFMNIPDNIDS